MLSGRVFKLFLSRQGNEGISGLNEFIQLGDLDLWGEVVAVVEGHVYYCVQECFLGHVEEGS